MAQATTIEWTTHTFNPWIGCQKVSPACRYCYAETDAFVRFGKVKDWHTDRQKTSDATWDDVLVWNKDAEGASVRPRVFCASEADVFDDSPNILPAWRQALWDLIERTTNLDWQLLTKRPHNIARLVPTKWMTGFPQNVWVGVTAENQEWANTRIPILLTIPAVVRFISAEPLLGSLDLTTWLKVEALDDHLRHKSADDGLQWVITGGESDARARVTHPAWFRTVHSDCRRHGIPVFFKQYGSYLGIEVVADKQGRPTYEVPAHFGGAHRILIASGPGRAFSQLTSAPEQHPAFGVGAVLAIEGSKKETGHTIDGVTYRAFPNTPFTAPVAASLS